MLDSDDGMADEALENPFLDLDAEDPYYEMVLRLYAMGAFQGWQLGDAFETDREITRAELVVLLVWLLQQLGEKLPEAVAVTISDVDAGYWAYEEILMALNGGWIQLDADGAANPDESITRGEAAAVVNRAMGREADRETLHEAIEQGLAALFPDLPVEHPDFYEVMEAAIPHICRYNRDRTEDWSLEEAETAK